MSRPAISVPPDASLAEAAELMLEKGVGSLCVVDRAGRLEGILTDSDFSGRQVGIPFSTFRAPQVLGRWLGPDGVEEVYREARRRSVGEIMSSPVHSVEEGAGLSAVLRVMLDHDIKHVPVVREGRPVGMVARHDLLKLLAEVASESGSGRKRDEA